ncbi:cytochrome c oxidase subunit 6B2-like isoform X1 [Dinothrombium tinctorium]|uniref:Cytochrome c oxidase subunit n=1 Tax=Dinothrombium tinctorium TaxID=1965070 RepID=A0A443RJ76_9ACAR|nr:cytochrome c oxidase subunit 6B2-like isoform X1 [Dinothrombium tinctorium]
MDAIKRNGPYPFDELRAAPYDPRFPNQNQTRNCYQNYLDYHRCRKVKGEDYEPCKWFEKIYKVICPRAWYEKWDEQRENGTFPGNI